MYLKNIQRIAESSSGRHEVVHIDVVVIVVVVVVIVVVIIVVIVVICWHIHLRKADRIIEMDDGLMAHHCIDCDKKKTEKGRNGETVLPKNPERINGH